MAFYGYLIKIGNNPLPMRFIKYDTYSVTPAQRLETEAKRSTDGILHRSTGSHMPVKIEFETPIMTNKDIDTLTGIFGGAFSNIERKLTIEYYDPSSNSYKTATCYMPDSTYKMLWIQGTVIYYESIRFAFIEY